MQPPPCPPAAKCTIYIPVSVFVKEEEAVEEKTAVSAVSSEEMANKTVEPEQASKAWEYNYQSQSREMRILNRKRVET